MKQKNRVIIDINICKIKELFVHFLCTVLVTYFIVYRNSTEYACIQIAPDNVLCHHNKHLMGYFERWDIWLLFLNTLSFDFVPTPNKSLTA